jgi:putative protein kinase ArgK-like GTPase of G3E family
MEKSILQKFERVAFPENITSVISVVMEKYGLSETDEEILEKLSKGQDTESEKVAKIVKRAASTENGAEDLFLEIKEVFKLPDEDAKSFAKEIKEKILILAQKISEEEIAEVVSEEKLKSKQDFSEKKEGSLPKISSYHSSKEDIYKEPIE